MILRQSPKKDARGIVDIKSEMAFLLTVERFAGLNGGVAYTAQHRDKNSLREKLGMVALAVAVAAGCVIEREEKVSKIEHGMNAV